MTRFLASGAAALLLACAVPYPGAAQASATQFTQDLVLDGTGGSPRMLGVAATLARADAPAGTAAGTAPTGGSITRELGLKGLFSLGWHDLGRVVVAPANWDRTDWLTAGGVGAAVVGSALWLDQPARDAALRNQTDSRTSTAKQLQKFGAEYAVATVVGLYGYGLLADDRNAESAGIDGGIASVIAGGVIVPVLKEVFGRARPRDEKGRYHFAPFSGDASFPSGHTTEAFVVAAVVADHYPSPWVAAGAYGLAGLVGASRVYRDAHWVSDTIAGAAIGAFVGHEVVKLDARLGDRAHVAPTTILGVPALALRVDF